MSRRRRGLLTLDTGRETVLAPPVMPQLPPPLPAAPRMQLTADEQIRATALGLANQWRNGGGEERVFALADRFAAYIRGNDR